MKSIRGFFEDGALLFKDVVSEENTIKMVSFVLDIRGVLIGVILSVGYEFPDMIDFFRSLVFKGNSEGSINETPEFRNGEASFKEAFFRLAVFI